MGVITDGVKDTYITEYNKNPVCTLFMTVLVLFLAVLAVAGIVTGGKSILGFLHLNPDQVFMDYFTSIMFSYSDPYIGWRVIYPPLATVFYAVIGQFTVPFTDLSGYQDLSFALRNAQMGLMSYFAVTLVAIYAFHIILSKLTSKNEFRTELLFLLLVFSFPFLTAIERGNNIIIVLVLCFIFLMGYRSENKWIRYASYVSLGCAAGFKLYPAILGLLVIRERKYREALKCALIGILVLLLPFLLTDGDPFILLENIGLFISAHAYGSVNIGQIVNYLLLYLAPGVGIDASSTVGVILTAVMMILSFIVIIFDRKMKHWKVLTLIACNLIIGPGTGTPYIYIYALIPITYFLVSEKEMTNENILFIICFSLTVAVFAGFGFGGEWVTLEGIKSAFVMIMAVVLMREGISRICRGFGDRPSATGDANA